MKFRMILASVAFACVGFGTPAFAQGPSPQAEAWFHQYIASHPEVQRNPSLMTNQNYLNSHPTFAQFLETHPNIRNQAFGMGAWDRNHQWHDADWWHQNDPDWVYQNHPDWNQSHPAWMNNGDYDDTHHWRNRQWWEQNHPNWVKEHHPHWAQPYPTPLTKEDGHGHHGQGNAYGHYKQNGPGQGHNNGND
jgi:hypothetical protein